MSTKRRRAKKNKNGLPIVIFVVAFFCVAVGVKTIGLHSKSAELEQQKESLESQIEQEEQRTKDLEELEKYMKTKKYMEEVAREKLGLVYPDEILIQPSNK